MQQQQHNHQEQTYNADMDHMQRMMETIRQLQEEARRYREQAAVPNCATLFTDVAAVSQALGTMVQSCLDQCQRMGQSGRVEEYIQAGQQANRAA